MPLTIYGPYLPCGRVSAQCPRDSATDHPAHDWKSPEVLHLGWHCYGFSHLPNGQGVGWPGGTEEPTDLVDICQNHPDHQPDKETTP